MLRAFSTAATGMSAQQMIVDTIANNLANINTTGFKRSQIDFQDLMYIRLKEPGREIASGVVAPSGFEIGCGVRPAWRTCPVCYNIVHVKTHSREPFLNRRN